MARTAAAAVTGAGHQRRGRRQRASNPWAVLATVITGQFMLLVDVSIVNVAIPSIQQQLGASSGEIELIAAGYQLAFACVLITAGRLGDLYGRRRIFLIGMTGFTLASVACGAAPSADALVAGRVMQGFLGGLMFPQVLSVIQVTFPPERRGRALGVFGAVIGVATAVGPLLGGVLIYADVLGLGWRAIFYVNVPIGVIALAAAWRWLPESRAQEADRLDFPGVALVTAGLFLLVYPITEGRAQGWPLYMLGMLALSVLVLAGFAALEHRRTRRDASPLMPTTLFADQGFRVGLVLMFVFVLGLPAFFFTFTLFLQNGFGYSPLEAGLVQFFFAVGSGTASYYSDRVTRRIGKRVLQVGTFVVMCGMAGMAAFVAVTGADMNAYLLAPLLVLTGAGLGTFIAPVINIVLAGVRSARAGAASGLLTTVQRIAGAMGVAIVGVLFFGLLGSHAPAAATSVQPELAARLRATGIPESAAARITAGFQECFADRAGGGSSPHVTPASCRRLTAGTGLSPQRTRVVRRIVAEHAATARKDLYAYAFMRALAYEVGVAAVAFLLVFRLRSGAARGAPSRA